MRTRCILVHHSGRRCMSQVENSFRGEAETEVQSNYIIGYHWQHRPFLSTSTNCISAHPNLEYMLVVEKLQYTDSPSESKPHHRVALRFGTREEDCVEYKLQATAITSEERWKKKRTRITWLIPLTTSLLTTREPTIPLCLPSSRRKALRYPDRLVHLLGQRPGSSPCRQLDGSLACKLREGITRPIEGLTEDFAVHHHFPGVYGEVCIVETPIKFLRSLWFVGGIVVGTDIFVS